MNREEMILRSAKGEQMNSLRTLMTDAGRDAMDLLAKGERYAGGICLFQEARMLSSDARHYAMMAIALLNEGNIEDAEFMASASHSIYVQMEAR